MVPEDPEDEGEGEGEESEEEADDEEADAEEADAEDADAEDADAEDADAEEADAEEADAEEADAEEAQSGDEDASANADASADENADEDADEDAEEEQDAEDDDDGDTDLPDVDEDVFASRDAWDADDEDFEDDAGDWTSDDYHEVATTLFGDHEFFGDTAEQRYLDEGFNPVDEDHPYVSDVMSRVPEGAAIRFFEKDGNVVPRGFLTSAALALLESSFPDLVLDLLHITVQRRPLDVQESIAQPTLPDALKNVTPADSVDLRKYATPVGDQGSTSRCAAFAWTHALEMLGNIQGKPLPRLACSFTMYRFQQLQGDLKDWKWAWKGGDGTSGTWQPGKQLFTAGTCRHDLWHNDKKEPSAGLDELEADAQNHRVDAEVYDVTVEEMKKCLSAGLPVQISMATGEAFQDIGRDGVMKAAEKPSGQHGYHAMLCVGYVGNYFIVKNSWGDDWGDKGYCYIPKKVLVESEPEAVAIVPRKPGAAAPPPPQAPSPAAHPASAAARPAFASGPAFAPAPAPAFAPAPARAAAPALPSVICTSCTLSVPHGKFCSDCGAVLPPPAPPASARRFCAHCGTPRGGAGRFCAKCGAKHD